MFKDGYHHLEVMVCRSHLMEKYQLNCNTMNCFSTGRDSIHYNSFNCILDGNQRMIMIIIAVELVDK